MRDPIGVFHELRTRFKAFQHRFEEFLNTDDPQKAFYKEFLALCYHGTNMDGVLFLLAELMAFNLKGYRNDKKLFEHTDYEFWINYRPFNEDVLNKHIGRLFNAEEVAYRVLAEDRDIVKVSNNDNLDHILYYYKLFINEKAIKEQDIVSLHETVSVSENIKAIQISKIHNNLNITITTNDFTAPLHVESASSKVSKEVFHTEKAFQNYSKYFKKIFGIDTSFPQYIKDARNFEGLPIISPVQCFIYNFHDGCGTLDVGSIMVFSSGMRLPDDLVFGLNDVQTWLSALYRLEVDFNNKYTERKIKSESIKSAKAAIMSRNMSHNLGSHVMFYIKQKLQSVSKIVNNNVLHNIIPSNLEDINIKTITDKIAANKDVELPFLVGLGRFINYLQERQDYIATVATNYIPARSTISFKDFIYDELKPDLRYERHKRNNSSSDNGWQPKNLLLDYIAYSEGYSKSDAIEIKFGEFDGHNPLDVTAETDFQALRKFNVAVPGGVIGRQAIFSIVENIIRNAAKHSEHRPDGKLVLQLSLVDAEKDFTGDFLTDKFRCMRKEKGSMESGESLVKLYQNHKDAFHILRIKLDMPNKKEDIEALVGKLGEDYVEEDGSMKETSKGLKEMRISAAWLRGHSIDTAIPTTKPPVLAVYSEPYREDKDKETISYFLCIPKPCKVAFVVDKELLTYIDDNGKESSYLDLNPMLEPFGCAVFGYDDEAKMLSKKRQNEEEQNKENKYKISDIADYEIVCMLLDDKQKSEKVNSILPYISSRHITNEETTKAILETLKNASDKKSAIDTIYEYWFKDKYPMSSSKLMVADAKANTDSKKAKSPLSEDSSVVLSTTGSIVSIAQSGCANSVVYSTHFKGLNHTDNVCDVDNLEKLESKEKKNAEYNQWLSNAACIESITGNNSTDRLIRQDEWTKEWKYKHLSAGLARVAIFDERIFSTFVKKEKIITKEIVEAIKQANPNNADEVLFNKYDDIIDDIDAGDIVNNPECIDKFIPEGKNDSHTYDIAQKNYERRIWAFNIEADKNLSDTINILGYDAKVGDNINWTDNNTNKPPVVIATLKAENGKYDIKLSEEDTNIFPDGKSQIFDYITIHQGILDKIYNVFGIKENTEDNRKKKLEVTNALHCYFSRHNAISNEATNFLPNFIIHSGRSKPNEQDMPQHQPFVQFAAVDHAVKDCKYTLVELLATAHYEDNNNN